MLSEEQFDRLAEIVADLAHAGHRVADGIAEDKDGNEVPLNDAVQCGLRSIARSITDGAPNHDAAGGYVGSLTEAVMGLTGAMVRIGTSLDGIADSLNGIAEAIRDRGS